MLLSVALLLGTAAPAFGAYDHVDGGTVTPSVVAAGGQTSYAVTLTGRSAVTDVVLAVDASGSMNSSFGPSSRWAGVQSAAFGSGGLVDALVSRGLFSGGGRVGVVVYGDAAATAIAPSTDVATIKSSLASFSPSAAGSCIGCGLQRALDLLAAVPGAASHRQLVYVLGDGNDTGDAGSLTAAIAAAQAAHVERRNLSVGAGVLADLDRADSSGAAQNTTSPSDLGTSLTSEPTVFPGASDVTWTFHLTPGFMASQPTATAGTVVVNGQDVVWTIPSVGATTVSLTFPALHAASGGCGQTALLTGTSFSDAEGDAAPSPGLGALTVQDCPPPGGGGGSGGGGTPTPGGGGGAGPTPGLQVGMVSLAISRISTTSATTLRLTLSAAAKVRLSFARTAAGRRVGKRCVKPTRANRRKKRCVRYVAAGTLTRNLAPGAAKVAVSTKLDGGRKLAPGTYRVTVGATGADGKAITIKVLTLKVVKRR